MIPEKLFLHKLCIANENVKEAPSSLFAASLYEFLNMLEHQNKFEQIEAYAITEKTNNTASLVVAERELLQKLQSINKEIEYYYREHSITLPPINYIDINGMKELSEFQAYEQGIIMSSSPLNSLIQTVTRRFDHLLQTDVEKHNDFVKQYADLNNNYTIPLDMTLYNNPSITHEPLMLNVPLIIKLKIDTLIKNWWTKQQDFERNQGAAFWYAWEKLKQFHTLYQKGKTLENEMPKNGHFLDEWDTHNTLKQIENITDESEYTHELKTAQQKIFLFVQDLSSTNISSPNTNKTQKIINQKTITVTSNPDNTITISTDNGNDYTLNRYRTKNREYYETIKSKILCILLNIQSGLTTQQLVKKLKLKDTQIWRGCDGINTTFLDELGIDEFIFENEKGKFKINDNYNVHFTNHIQQNHSQLTTDM